MYLNQASLGLVPRRSTEAMVDFLVDVAQYGNVRLSDDAEERILDDLRAAAAGAVRRAAAVDRGGGRSERGARSARDPDGDGRGEVVLVASDFPSVTYPWLAARERLGHARSRGSRTRPDRISRRRSWTASSDGTTVVCVSAVQYATGSMVDVGEVVRRAHAVGARVIVDVTQMAGAMPVSLRAWCCRRARVQRVQVAVHARRRRPAGGRRRVAGGRAVHRRLEGRPSTRSSSTRRRWRSRPTRDGSSSRRSRTARPPA